MSEIMKADAESMAVEIARGIIREALDARLRERLGVELAEVGRAAADNLADDVLANLEIEALIAKRGRDRRAREAQTRQVFARGAAPDEPERE